MNVTFDEENNYKEKVLKNKLIIMNFFFRFFEQWWRADRIGIFIETNN